MAFVRRLIDITFQLGEGDFGQFGLNQVKISGLRVAATIIKAGMPSMGTAQLQVYGLTLSKINQLSTLGVRPTTIRKNNVIVTAGNEGDSHLATIFNGTIVQAAGEFSGAPQVPFVIEAQTGMFDAVYPAPPLAYRGSVEVATVLQGLASHMGVSFRNYGVQGYLLSNPYFAGSARNQAYAAALAAGINIEIDNLVMSIWPPTGSVAGAAVLVSKETGMIGYPTYTSKGIMFQTEFNPNIGFGGLIEMRSDLTPANGIKTVNYLAHELDSQVPNGRWKTIVEAWAPDSGGDAVVAR